MNAILQVENLTKQYADFKLDHVSFSVPKGTIMGLIGENGAGKSTTINAILDLIHKDDGTVTFWGQELSSTKQIKEDVGVVFDGINFYETLTPAKVGKIAGAAYKQWDGHLFQDYLKRFQLPADKEIKSLSKGMKMKLCIAVALSHNPKLSMCISSSTPCGFTKSRFCPTWTDQPTHGRAASTAAPMPLWNISRVKSWRCATGRGFTKSTS